MHDPDTLVCQIMSPIKRGGYRAPLISVWHHDPSNYDDVTCQFFARAKPDDPMLARIVREFERDWDSIYSPTRDDHDEDDGPFSPRHYPRGLFMPGGEPRFSLHGITLNLFFTAAFHFFNGNRKKAVRFMRRNLFDILLFAENTCDSLADNFLQTFGATKREERITQAAAIIYGWILRESRPWWKHPGFHLHHLRLQIHPWQALRRRLLTRCRVCGKPFIGETPVSDCWDRPPVRWFRGETHLRHGDCDPKNAPTPKNPRQPIDIRLRGGWLVIVKHPALLVWWSNDATPPAEDNLGFWIIGSHAKYARNQ